MSEIQLGQVDYSYSAETNLAIAGVPQRLRGLQVPMLQYDDLLAVMKQANDSYDIIKGPSGSQYEVAVFGTGPIMLKPSTSFSSLYKNPGNALETAVEAAMNPGVSIVYVASLGNHPTSNRNLEELRYIRDTGRRTLGDGSPSNPYRPLRSLDDQSNALYDHGFVPKFIKADAEAGREALGLMVAFETDSIEQVFLNGLDGLSKSAHYARSRLTEDARSRINRRAIKDGQPGEVTPVNIKDVKKQMPNIYRGLGRIAHLAPLPVLLYPRDDIEKMYVTLGNRSHNDLSDLDDHAVYTDIGAALRNQESVITIQANSESPEHKLEDCIEFGRLAMDAIPQELRGDNRRIRFLLGEGGLDAHTDKPHESARVAGHVFPGIISKMVGYRGPFRTPKPISEEITAIRQSA